MERLVGDKDVTLGVGELLPGHTVMVSFSQM